MTVHLTWSWRCLDCEERSTEPVTSAAANRAAEAHTEATGHPTNTRGRPER